MFITPCTHVQSAQETEDPPLSPLSVHLTVKQDVVPMCPCCKNGSPKMYFCHRPGIIKINALTRADHRPQQHSPPMPNACLFPSFCSLSLLFPFVLIDICFFASCSHPFVSSLLQLRPQRSKYNKFNWHALLHAPDVGCPTLHFLLLTLASPLTLPLPLPHFPFPYMSCYPTSPHIPNRNRFSMTRFFPSHSCDNHIPTLTDSHIHEYKGSRFRFLLDHDATLNMVFFLDLKAYTNTYTFVASIFYILQAGVGGRKRRRSYLARRSGTARS